ncbi:MAG: PD-(D/E)XK nuclease family protein, partial [Candidatus Aminicenantes bacterium]|nr:PD-(D/E)XK nuclease family protein [Candidatus Aminicenantes bacterium]
DSLHRLFFPEDVTDFPSLLAFLRRALESVGSVSNRKAHLFLNEYAATALQALAELEEFAAARQETLGTAKMADMAAMVRAHFRGRTIRFEGSPLKGIQVMGPLEFRGLSFDEVIILDALEGILPGTAKYDPILPADIRAVFKIRDHGDWEKIYAFNFFSLLGAAGRVHILYPRKDEDGRDCERSRFIERIAYEIEKRTGRMPETRSSSLPFSIPSRKLRKVIKNKTILDKLEELTLSPSSLEMYVKCPLQFFFARILGLQQREGIAVETEGSLIGTIAHETLRGFYQKYPSAGLMAAAGPGPLADDLEGFLFSAFREYNFDPEKGLEKIRSWTLMEQLQKFTWVDQLRMTGSGIQVKMLEKELSGSISVTWRPQPIPIQGRIDRCEVEGELLRIIDYKTGHFSLAPDNMLKSSYAAQNLSSASEDEYLQALNDFHKKYQGMQLLIYLLLLAQKENKTWAELDGAYVLLREHENFFRFLFDQGKRKREMNPKEKLTLMNGFRADLGSILGDLYSREYFLANPSDERYCSYCPFRLPCGNL